MKAVTTEGDPRYVDAMHRVAVFDNDGTLWVEQPLYPQLAFALDRVKALAVVHPEWKKQQPFSGILAGNPSVLDRLDRRQASALFSATHAGTTTEDFWLTVKDWFASAHHPRFERRYADCAYQPMLELLRYLRSRRFATYVVSGGGADFIRVVSQRVYGIPPDHVVGSSGRLRFEVRGDETVLVKLPDLDPLDEREEKPISIQQHVGERPIFAFGNSDGDRQMLEYTAGGSRPSLMLLLHHDDDTREYAYDRASKIGRLDQALDEAQSKGWTVVSMKSDWKTVLPDTY